MTPIPPSLHAHTHTQIQRIVVGNVVEKVTDRGACVTAGRRPMQAGTVWCNM